MGRMETGMRSISVFDAEMAPEEIAEGYMRGLAQQLILTPAYLNRIDIGTLRRPGNKLVVIRQAGRVVAGLHTAPGEDDRRPIVWINGLFSQSRIRGVARHLIAEAILHADPDGTFGAKIRVMPSGRINAPAARAFALNGFAPTAIRRYEIAANPLDGHLYDSAEPDGETYRAMTLVARPIDRRFAAPVVVGGR